MRWEEREMLGVMEVHGVGSDGGGCVGEEAEPLVCTVPLTVAFVLQSH